MLYKKGKIVRQPKIDIMFVWYVETATSIFTPLEVHALVDCQAVFDDVDARQIWDGKRDF